MRGDLAKPEERKLTPLKGFAGVFAAVFMLVFLGSAAITFLMPETYIAVARVKVPTDEAIQIYQSETVLIQVTEQLNLQQTFARRYGEARPIDKQRAVDILRRSIRVRGLSGSPLAEIRAFSRNPEEAALFANTVVEAGCKQLGGSSQFKAGSSMVERAVPPLKAARPNKLLNLALGAIVGAFLGAMAGGVGARLAVGVQPRGTSHEPEN